MAGCSAPVQEGVKTNDTVRVLYTLSFQDGTEFQSNVNGTPLEFTVGSGQVIPGFDDAVRGMTPGMTKTISIGADAAYGLYRSQLVYTMDTDKALAISEKLKQEGNYHVIQYPVIGPVVMWEKPDGDVGYIRFTNITDETITIDENHPLAGKDLIYEITLVEIVHPGT